ncbi:MAG: hypothetical protein KDA24_29215 [Deltaproteobacteria bacterium]|nr:hypothetical protein [Deltaproteobacteria bacterium]
MRIVSSLALAAVLLASAGCDMLIPEAKGFFYLKNGTDKHLEVLVSDNDKCVIGLHSSVGTSTWRNYDLENKEAGAYLCVDKQPFKVTDGKSYEYKEGSLVETEAPQF